MIRHLAKARARRLISLSIRSGSANLWAAKQKITERLVEMLGADNADIHLIDGFPIDVCVRTIKQKKTV